MKYGLKLWSLNTDFYYNEAKRLYDEGVFDFIELYIIPETLHTLNKWKELAIPFSLHAPHFMHKVNLADSKKREYNLSIFKQVQIFLNELNPQYVVIHGGIEGSIEETAHQLEFITKSLLFPISTIVIENKPFVALPNQMEQQFCRGATIEEIQYVMNETGCGFCLDFGHAICSANSLQKEPYSFIKDFNTLHPISYHLSDNNINTTFDQHLHFGEGNYDFSRIVSVLDKTKNIVIETKKNSTINLDDFVQDITFLKKKIMQCKS